MRMPNIVVLILVTGCVTAVPVKHEIKTHEHFPVPFNTIWSLSTDFLETKVADIETADKKSGFIKTAEFNVPHEGFQYQSKYADCGKLGGLYVYHDIIGFYEIYISELDANSSMVSTIANFRASLWLGNKFKGWIPCQSRGYIEQLFKDDVRAKIQKSYPDVAMGHQQEDSMDKESDEKSATHILKIQTNEHKRTAIPQINMIPESELIKLRNKYENTLRENEKLNKEIIILKRNRNVKKNEKNQGEAESSRTESFPELKIKPDNDVTSKILLDKERSLATEPLMQGNDDKTQIFTIQTGSFPDIDLAREHIVLITVLLQEKDYDNLRIEKTGDFYIVRLGKFENYETAKKFHQDVKPRLSEAVILKAQLNNESIIRVYE